MSAFPLDKKRGAHTRTRLRVLFLFLTSFPALLQLPTKNQRSHTSTKLANTVSYDKLCFVRSLPLKRAVFLPSGIINTYDTKFFIILLLIIKNTLR